jgi:hypothetical protein
MRGSESFTTIVELLSRSGTSIPGDLSTSTTFYSEVPQVPSGRLMEFKGLYSKLGYLQGYVLPDSQTTFHSVRDSSTLFQMVSRQT